MCLFKAFPLRMKFNICDTYCFSLKASAQINTTFFLKTNIRMNKYWILTDMCYFVTLYQISCLTRALNYKAYFCK